MFMRLEFKKIGGFLLGFPGWTLEDDRIICKNNEYLISKMYNIKNFFSPKSYHYIMFHYDGNDKPIILHYDRDDENKNNGIKAYEYLLKESKDRRKYVFDNFVIESDGVTYNGKKIPFSEFTKFEEKILSINGSDGSFTTEYNNSIIEIKYKGIQKINAKEAIELANKKIESFNKYENIDEVNKIISDAIKNNDNPRKYSNVSKKNGLNENILKTIDEYEISSVQIMKNNDFDVDKSIKEFKKKNKVDDVTSKYFINSYKNKLDQVKVEMNNNSIIDYAKELLVENDGNKFATIKEIKSKYNCSIDEATKYVNKALSSFEDEDSKPIIHNTKITPTDINKIKNKTNVAKCPHCGSTSFKRISTTKKVVSTGLFGLASSTIGKTFSCNKCGYKW